MDSKAHEGVDTWHGHAITSPTSEVASAAQQCLSPALIDVAKKPPSVTFRPPARARSWSGPLRGTAEQRGYGAEWRKLRLMILQRDRRLCQPCLRIGIVQVGRIVDHIKPKAEGGTDDPANLETVCDACDKVKTAAEAKRGQARRR